MLVTDYLNLNSLDFIVDGLIINSLEYSSSGVQTFSFNKLSAIIKSIKNANKKVLLNCDKIISSFEVNKFESDLEKVFSEIDYLIYSDYCIFDFPYINKNKCIYNAPSLTSSLSELCTLETKAFLCNELSKEEIDYIIENIKDKKICFNVFGHIKIMYSKRFLLSFYNDIYNKDFKKNKIYSLKEEFREGDYLVIETNNCFNFYTNYIYYLSNEIFSWNHNIFMYRINSFNLDNSTLLNVIAFYNLILEKKIIDLELLKELNISKGFLEKKSILLKGDEDE